MKKGKFFIPYLVLCMTAATFSACGSKDKGSGEVIRKTTTTTERPMVQETTTTTTTKAP